MQAPDGVSQDDFVALLCAQVHAHRTRTPLVVISPGGVHRIHATPGCAKSWRQLYCETLLSRRTVARVPLKVCDFKFAVDVYIGESGDNRRLLHTGVYDISPSVVAERKNLLNFKHIRLAEPVYVRDDTIFCVDVAFFSAKDGNVCSLFHGEIDDQLGDIYTNEPDGKQTHMNWLSHLTVPRTFPVGSEDGISVLGWIYLDDSDVDDRFVKDRRAANGAVATTQQLYLCVDRPRPRVLEPDDDYVMDADWFLRLC